MGYVKRVLRSDEVIVYRGKLHWTIYIYAMLFAAAGIGLLFLAQAFPRFETAMIVSAVTAFILAFLAAVKAWFDQWITEICVTSHRVIYKRGFIWRHTSEMNMQKVESVTVRQSLLGRLLDYGTIHVRGTGEGIEHLHRIDSPVELRNAILVR
ncbi:MAG TPA: PH domain-containing protein [Nitrospiraceae bacterium]|jgi:uncharacterized membrane protein YdbT with pleckstrin-like domain